MPATDQLNESLLTLDRAHGLHQFSHQAVSRWWMHSRDPVSPPVSERLAGRPPRWAGWLLARMCVAVQPSTRSLCSGSAYGLDCRTDDDNTGHSWYGSGGAGAGARSATYAVQELPPTRSNRGTRSPPLENSTGRGHFRSRHCRLLLLTRGPFPCAKPCPKPLSHTNRRGGIPDVVPFTTNQLHRLSAVLALRPINHRNLLPRWSSTAEPA